MFLLVSLPDVPLSYQDRWLLKTPDNAGNRFVNCPLKNRMLISKNKYASIWQVLLTRDGIYLKGTRPLIQQDLKLQKGLKQGFYTT